MATLLSVIKTLESLALQEPNIRSAGENDLIAFMNGNPEIKYGVFYITQNTHSSTDLFDYYGLNLFFLDRMTDDGANELAIESYGKQVLDKVVDTFCAYYNGEIVGERKYQSFADKFKDRVAGEILTVKIMLPKDVICIE